MTLQLKIKINSEYQKLVPEIPAQEFAAFKSDIKERGQLVPITVNNQGIILDGHHRFRACQELGIECNYTELNFDNKLLEKLYVIDANLKRRHLNSFQRVELALSSKSILQEIVKGNESLGGKLKGKGVRNLTPLGRVDREIGKLAGVSYDTVRKVELISSLARQDILFKLRSGGESINGAYNKIVKDQRRQELTIKASSKTITSKANCNDRFQLINNDFRQVKEINDNSVDLIFTDPPYEENCLGIYDDLAKFASNIYSKYSP